MVERRHDAGASLRDMITRRTTPIRMLGNAFHSARQDPCKDVRQDARRGRKLGGNQRTRRRRARSLYDFSLMSNGRIAR
jgi:hypothetical protein